MTLQQLADRIGITPERLLSETGMMGKELTNASTVTEDMLRAMIEGKKKSLSAARAKSASPVPAQARTGKADNSLAALIRDNSVLVDASVLLSPGWDAFLERILPMLIPGEKRLDIPLPVLEELQSQVEQADGSPDTMSMYQPRLARLSQLNRENLVSVRERDLEDSTSTQEILTICAALKMITPLLVLTRDEKLAADLLMLNRQPSAVGKTITVRGIDDSGEPDVLFAKKAENTVNGKFRVFQKVSREPDKLLPIDVLPKVGDTLTTAPDGGDVHILKEELACGKEGVIYRTITGMAAKIYHAECRTVRRLEKLRLLLDASLTFSGICFPTAMLYNGQGEPVGYLMNLAKGEPLSWLLEDKNAWQTCFPDWTREDLVQLAITIMDKLRFLHGRSILIGDLDPANFLVVSQKEVYLVDMDSVQLNDLPCPTGCPLYTSPELHKRHKGDPHDFSNTMRDGANENFALAVFLFRLLMAGNVPCTQPVGEVTVEEVLQKQVSQLVWDKAPAENLEDLTGWYIWSQMTHRMKKLLRKIFTTGTAGGEKRLPYNIGERLTSGQWFQELNGYLQTLKAWRKEMEIFCQKNHCTVNDIEANRVDGCPVDPQSFVICATRTKRSPGEVYRNCTDCGREFIQGQLRDGRCEDCRKKAPPAEIPKPEKTAAKEPATKSEPMQKSISQLTKFQKLKARLRMAMDAWHRI